MALNPIALAIPGFFVLIGVELLVARLRRREVYRFPDAMSDLGCGVSSQVFAVFFSAAQLAVYAWVYARWSLVELPVWGQWLAAFVGVDLLYYWWHRASHEVHALWAAHVVHHQSEDYNLAVALRQALFTSFTSVPFYLPLALLGVPPLVYAIMVALSTLYQFWIHSELIPKLGPLELVLNTASHHRVHHAVNPRYLDKNYGAILIIWDRLFGTFTEEQEAPVYGTVEPLRSFNPIWANLAQWGKIGALAREARGPGDVLRAIFGRPGWRPSGVVEPPEVTPETRPKYDPPAPRGARLYVVAWFVLVAVALFSLLMWPAAFSSAATVAIGVLVFWSVVNFTALLEHKRWAVPAEVARVLAVIMVAVVL